MLNYGATGRDSVHTGSGDLSEKLLSGSLQSARPLPRDEDVPQQFRPICVSLGYTKWAPAAGSAAESATAVG